MTVGRIPNVEGGIQPTIVTTKGDLIAATAASNPARLAVGANNTTLIADSAEATGLKYAASLQSTLTTTGDSIYASGANTPARLAIGSTGQVLTVAAGLPSWATPSSGGMTLLSTTTLSGTTTAISSIPSGYNSIQVYLYNATYTGASSSLFVNPNASRTITTSAAARTGSTQVESKVASDFYAVGDGGFASGNNFAFVEIFNYASTSTNKAIRGAGGDASAGGQAAGYVNTTSAITSLQIRTFDSRSFTGGTVLLYGVK
jgi:hypothetical protein